MSVAYYLVLDQDIPDFDASTDGRALAGMADEINECLAKAGHKTLDDYLWVGEFFDEDEANEASDEGAWWSAQEGLAFIQSLRQSLEQCGKDTRAEQAEEDLQEYERVLKKAQAENRRWRLALDF